MADNYQTIKNVVLEWGYTSSKSYSDPFDDIELDAIVRGPEGVECRIPAYWGGNCSWRFRFSASQPGFYTFLTVCSDSNNHDLHDQVGSFDIQPYSGLNPLYQHGSLQVSRNHRFFEHLDGKPFFWLGDTWWMAFTDRLKWPDDFHSLVLDRVEKGFTVVQLVAGLYPDMEPFDSRGANEGGFAWEEGFSHLNPAFYDYVDIKLRHLIQYGLTPMLVGAWGYYLPIMGVDKVKQHWRYLVARYGAYPVIWCLAGETLMPLYRLLSSPSPLDRQKDRDFQKQGWSEVAQYFRKVDPYHRLLTTHSAAFSHGALELIDPQVLDFSLIQTGHGNHVTAVRAAKSVADMVANSSIQPLVNGETCYEGILGTAWQDVQRFCFWSSLLSGVAGYTYGANGIWQASQATQPYGPSPHGMSWGDMSWEEASRLPGSKQLSLAKKFLTTYPWWRFESHQEWIEPSAGEDDYFRPYAAGIPGELRIFYFPSPLFPWDADRPVVKGLEPGVNYQASFYNPISGARTAPEVIGIESQGSWQVTAPSSGQDIVLILEKVS